MSKYFVVGKKYFIRTVTNFYVGELIAEEDDKLVLVKAAWIADTGRFADFIKSGDANEVEPYVDSTELAIFKAGIIDVNEWKFALPLTQK